MNKLILVFSLVLTPFFSSFFVFADLQDEMEGGAMPSTNSTCIITGASTPDLIPFIGSSCPDLTQLCLSTFSDSPYMNGSDTSYEWRNMTGVRANDTGSTFDVDCTYDLYSSGYWNDNNWEFESVKISNIGTFSYVLETTKTCPPDDTELYNYIIGKDFNDDGEVDMCFPEEDNSCPEGYLKLPIKIDGELQCKPVECDSAGDSKSIWAQGSIYTNNQGTYCDGSCAHTVEGGQNDDGFKGNIRIFAVSTGESCGQGYDFSMHDGDGSDCQSVDVGTGTNFLSCPEGNDDNSDNPDEPDDTPDEPPVDLEEEKADDDDLPDIPTNEESCAENDPSCEIRNLKEKLETENDEKKQQDNSLHNKNITAIEKSTNSIVNNITQASNDTADRNADGFKSVTDAVGKLADAIKDGGGGGGDSDEGFCDGEGNCSTSVEIRTEPSDGLEGFWETEYEEGLQGIFEEKLIDVKQTEFYLFLDQFKPTFGGGSAPDYQFCFDLGFVNFGCQSLGIDSRVFPAVRIFILITAVFLCRKILFGG